MTLGIRAGSVEVPFPKTGSMGEGQLGERMATVWNCPVNYQDWAGANLKFTDFSG